MTAFSAGSVVVLHHNTGDQFPLRSSVGDHLFAWRRYSGFRVSYVNVAFGHQLSAIRALAPQAVVFHTTLLSTRWSPDLFRAATRPLLELADLPCAKVAVPQDEFIHTRLLDDFLADSGATHVLTCAGPADWPKIYPRTVDRAALRTVLTGYLDESTVRRVRGLPAPAVRDVDVGYRAWKAAAWLGGWGRHKVLVAERVGESARRRDLVTDISLEPSDTLLGDDWFRFLLRCRAVVGVEGGASILDIDGATKQQVEEFTARRPGATYEEVEAACFPGRDGGLQLMALSPRHLEAALTHTAQLLVEGGYNGVLVPGRHYFAIRSDYSNVEEALDFLADVPAVEAMTEHAFADLVTTGVVSYRRFIEDFDRDVQAHCAGGTSAQGHSSLAAQATLRAREWAAWRRVGLHAVLLRESRLPAGRLARRLVRGAAYKWGRAVERLKGRRGG